MSVKSAGAFRGGRLLATWTGGLVVACMCSVLVLRLPTNGSSGPRENPIVVFADGVVRNGYRYAFGLTSTDFDGDGDVDLSSADTLGSTSVLYWFENDGAGTFAPHTIIEGEPGWLERHASGDINGDGRPDIVVVNNRDGRIIAYLSPPKPATGTWERRVISTKAARAYDVALGDYDGDGDNDVGVSWWAGSVVTYLNPGMGPGRIAEWPSFVVGSDMPEVRTIRAGDFNRDGKLDILASGAGVQGVPVGAAASDHQSSVAWFENRSTPSSPSWTKHLIDDMSRAPIHGEPADMDRDGDLDVVMAFGMRSELVPTELHKIAWYENVGSPGSGNTWVEHAVAHLPFAFEGVAKDIDNDGDIDVAATAWALGDRVMWFENMGDPKGAWLAHLVRQDWKAANQLVLTDLTGDGRVDIAATADDGSSRVAGANELRWWRNTAAGG